MKEKLKSRKFWVAIASVAILALQWFVSGKPPTADDLTLIAPALIYILGQSAVDFASQWWSTPPEKKGE